MGGIAAGAGIQGVGIGQKGAPTGRLDGGDNPPQIDRADKSRVAQFAEMQFDGYQIAGVDGTRQTGGIHQLAELGKKILLVCGSQIDKIDAAFHMVSPAVRPRSGKGITEWTWKPGCLS